MTSRAEKIQGKRYDAFSEISFGPQSKKIKLSDIVNSHSRTISKSPKIRRRSYSTKSSNNYQNITRLKKLCSAPKPFTTMDIETINVNGLQKPFLISCRVTSQVKSFITTDLSEKGIERIWQQYFTYLFSRATNNSNIIFVHNLGRFDGVFLQEYISKVFDLTSIESSMDESKRFISIKVVHQDRTYMFIDSLRIFPVSLNQLCEVFNVPGKLVPYKLEWNDISILSNKPEISNLTRYAKQDSMALYKSLKAAQELYISKYNVDITSIVSLPALALKIFRLCFLTVDIPILSGRNRYLC